MTTKNRIEDQYIMNLDINKQQIKKLQSENENSIKILEFIDKSIIENIQDIFIDANGMCNIRMHQTKENLEKIEFTNCDCPTRFFLVLYYF